MNGQAAPAQPPAVEGFFDLVKIGEGGFSTVYAATQSAIERRVAIKVLDLGFSDEHRFRRECRTLGTLSDIQGIVPVLHATFTDAGQPCIVMQLMDGGSLAHRIRSSGPMQVSEVINSGLRLCAALQQAHDRGIFHRDIKPENVLFQAGTAAIADFGIALVDDVESRSQTMDSMSPPHAPPERFAGGRADPALGDIYSLGSTLYSALAGRPPFGTLADGGLAGLIVRVTTQSVPDLGRLDVSGELEQVLAKSMSKDPHRRYSSMGAFGAALAMAASRLPGGGDSRTIRRAPSGNIWSTSASTSDVAEPSDQRAAGQAGVSLGSVGERHNGFAVAATVVGLISLVGSILSWIFPIRGLVVLLVLMGLVAVALGVFGVAGVKKANAQPGARQTGLALAGIVTGALGVLIGLAFMVFFVVFGATAEDSDFGDINSDPSDSVCDESRFLQDPDC